MADQVVLQVSKNHSLEPIEDEHGKPVGFIWKHKNQEGADCIGLIDLRSTHKVTSWDPLSLTPSLACSLCPAHGFVKLGYYDEAAWESQTTVKTAIWRMQQVGKGLWKVLAS